MVAICMVVSPENFTADDLKAIKKDYHLRHVSTSQYEHTENRPKNRQQRVKRTPKVFTVTAYTAGQESTGKSPGDPDYGITASGKRVQEGVTAACPPSMPFGTKIHIQGVGERVCQDRGGAIKENRIDVFMANRKQAITFGKRHLEVEIYAKDSAHR